PGPRPVRRRRKETTRPLWRRATPVARSPKDQRSFAAPKHDHHGLRTTTPIPNSAGGTSTVGQRRTATSRVAGRGIEPRSGTGTLPAHSPRALEERGVTGGREARSSPASHG